MTTLNVSDFSLSKNKLTKVVRAITRKYDNKYICDAYNVALADVVEVRKAMGAFALNKVEIVEPVVKGRGRPRTMPKIVEQRPSTYGVKFDTQEQKKSNSEPVRKPGDILKSLEGNMVDMAIAINNLGNTISSSKDTPMTPTVTTTPATASTVTIPERELFVTSPVLNPRKEEMRQKIANAPLRNYVKVYAAAMFVHDLTRDEMMKTFKITKSTARSMMWQAETDLRLNKLI